MRKTFLQLTTGILLATSLVVPVFAKDISILINNKEISTIDKPYIKESRTLVPIRVISENLGIAVDWDNDNRQVILNKENNKIALPIEKNYYFLGNNKIATDISGEIKNDRTFVPIRLIAELFDKEVSWNNDTKSVLINDKGTSQPINPIKSTNNFEQAKVVRVVDGDTIVVDRGRGEEKIRFVLVNTPETKHPKKGVEFYGKEASDFTKNALSNKTVYLQKDVSETDKYGRLLRYIWLERPTSNEPSNEEVRTKCFNAILLAGGYANVSTFPPDLQYVDLFRQIEREAREKNLGLWANGQAPEVKPEPSNNNNNQANQPVKNTGEKAYLHANGRIIGNKNSSIYHTPSGRDYKKVTLRNAVFFDTEEQARQAGFRPAKN